MGLSGRVPRRVDAVTKAGLLELIDLAVKDGWDHRRACRYLELRESRAWRWRVRRGADRLDDAVAGGHAVHGLLADEEAAIVAIFEQWGEIDRSHRKLAHRGSYVGRVWVSPSSVKRVLAERGLHLRRPRRAGTSQRRPFPEWVSYTKNSIWIYDTERHEALLDRAVVKGHRLRALAGVRGSWGQSDPRERGGGRQAALTTPGRVSTVRWRGSGKRDGKV